MEIAVKNNPEAIKYASKELQEKFQLKNKKIVVENMSLFEDINEENKVKKKIIIPKKIKYNSKENER